MQTTERALFLLLGHAINEVNVLNKLFYLSNNYVEGDKWRQHAHLTQGLILARALVGKLSEGWNLLGEGYFGTHLSKTYDKLLNPEAVQALDSLKKHFGRKSIIRDVRNGFAFHYSFNEIANLKVNDLDESELLLYMGENNGNTLFYGSEYVVNLAIMQSIDSSNFTMAFEALVDETQSVVAWFNEAAQGIMAEIAEIYLRRRDGTVASEEIDIGAQPYAEDLNSRS